MTSEAAVSSSDPDEGMEIILCLAMDERMGQMLIIFGRQTTLYSISRVMARGILETMVSAR
jgi:hypothetical protein